MILELFDWISIGCPDGVPLDWLYDVWKREVWQEFRYDPHWGAFDTRFPWDTLHYEHPDYLVRRRS